jgi:hypothetical protein
MAVSEFAGKRKAELEGGAVRLEHGLPNYLAGANINMPAPYFPVAGAYNEPFPNAAPAMENLPIMPVVHYPVCRPRPIYSPVGTILVLFILLVIILRSCKLPFKK